MVSFGLHKKTSWINIPRKYKVFLLTLIFATIVVLSAIRGAVSIVSVISIFLLTFIILLTINSATSNNIEGSVSSVTYPAPPHLGLDGVSLENQIRRNFDVDNVRMP